MTAELLGYSESEVSLTRRCWHEPRCSRSHKCRRSSSHQAKSQRGLTTRLLRGIVPSTGSLPVAPKGCSMANVVSSLGKSLEQPALDTHLTSAAPLLTPVRVNDCETAAAGI